MWAKLDDGLLDHPKIVMAGALLGGGRKGRANALGFYAAGILYCNKHLTDGVLSRDAVEHLAGTHVAGVMVKAGLWDQADNGAYRIHDFHDHNPLASDVQEKRRQDRERKKRGGQHRHGFQQDSFGKDS